MPGKEAGPEGRQAECGDGELHEGGAGDDKAAARGAAQHARGTRRGAGDVVAAGLGAALGHLARQQRVVAGQQRADAVLLFPSTRSSSQQQAQQLGLRLGRQHAVEHQLFMPARAGRAAGRPRRRCRPTRRTASRWSASRVPAARRQASSSARRNSTAACSTSACVPSASARRRPLVHSVSWRKGSVACKVRRPCAGAAPGL